MPDALERVLPNFYLDLTALFRLNFSSLNLTLSYLVIFLYEVLVIKGHMEIPTVMHALEVPIILAKICKHSENPKEPIYFGLHSHLQYCHVIVLSYCSLLPL